MSTTFSQNVVFMVKINHSQALKKKIDFLITEQSDNVIVIAMVSQGQLKVTCTQDKCKGRDIL